jgi:hypothetical protein
MPLGDSGLCSCQPFHAKLAAEPWVLEWIAWKTLVAIGKVEDSTCSLAVTGPPLALRVDEVKLHL